MRDLITEQPTVWMRSPHPTIRADVDDTSDNYLTMELDNDVFHVTGVCYVCRQLTTFLIEVADLDAGKRKAHCTSCDGATRTVEID